MRSILLFYINMIKIPFIVLAYIVVYLIAIRFILLLPFWSLAFYVGFWAMGMPPCKYLLVMSVVFGSITSLFMPLAMDDGDWFSRHEALSIDLEIYIEKLEEKYLKTGD